MSLTLDQTYYRQGYTTIAGCDEAGRGPIAGPVVAASVILPQDFKDSMINDSKQLTAKKRNTLFDVITRVALDYAVVVVDVNTITRLNILEASRLGMQQSLEKLNVAYDLVLSDAMALPLQRVNVVPIIHGDALSQTIAAASILAKVSRDRWMEKLHQQYPHFQFNLHKGYPTALHLRLLRQFGPITGVHRPTFGPVKRLSIHQ